MKLVVFLACILAIAYANEDANVIKNESEVNPDSFHYALELDNTIRAIQQGQFKDKDIWIVSGEYEFVTKDGKHIKVTYVADDYGYHPKTEYIYKR